METAASWEGFSCASTTVLKLHVGVDPSCCTGFGANFEPVTNSSRPIRFPRYSSADQSTPISFPAPDKAAAPATSPAPEKAAASAPVIGSGEPFYPTTNTTRITPIPVTVSAGASLISCAKP